MAVMKKKVRKRLSKSLARLVKRHGAEMTLALVSGIVSSLAADRADKAPKNGKKAKAGMDDTAGKKARARKETKPPAKPIVVVRKRAAR